MPIKLGDHREVAKVRRPRLGMAKTFLPLAERAALVNDAQRHGLSLAAEIRHGRRLLGEWRGAVEQYRRDGDRAAFDSTLARLESAL